MSKGKGKGNVASPEAALRVSLLEQPPVCTWIVDSHSLVFIRTHVRCVSDIARKCLDLHRSGEVEAGRVQIVSEAEWRGPARGEKCL